MRVHFSVIWLCLFSCRRYTAIESCTDSHNPIILPPHTHPSRSNESLVTRTDSVPSSLSLISQVGAIAEVKYSCGSLSQGTEVRGRVREGACVLIRELNYVLDDTLPRASWRPLAGAIARAPVSTLRSLHCGAYDCRAWCIMPQTRRGASQHEESNVSARLRGCRILKNAVAENNGERGVVVDEGVERKCEAPLGIRRLEELVSASLGKCKSSLSSVPYISA
ncbi:hypothetical protein EDB87DRAFT_1655443 [Lactarius vividus]|nr:hypothetical protein EDB87DRAFT_1655443 [Lactarius vividus]